MAESCIPVAYGEMRWPSPVALLGEDLCCAAQFLAVLAQSEVNLLICTKQTPNLKQS